MKKITSIMSIIFMGVLILMSCSKADGKKDAYVFAVDATWPPMEYVDTANDEVVGFTIDLVNAIAKAEGFEVKFVISAWDGIFPGLLKGDYDAVSSSVTITEERKKTMAFSDPYFNAGQILAMRKDMASSVSGLGDLTGQEVGAQIGTVGASEVAKYPGVILKTYDALGPAVEELANGTISGIVADTPLIADYLLQNQRYKDLFVTVGEQMTTEEYGIVFDPANTELLEKVNSGLATIKANGTYDKIYAEWIK